jgi:hypothetical protein
VEPFLKLLQEQWAVVSSAPFAFLFLAAAMFAMAFYAARWRYASVIDQVRAANDTLKERLHLKSEQAEQYKERALKYDQKVWEVVESDTSELSQKALKLVSEIREFVERRRRNQNAIYENEWGEMASASSEEEKRRLWNKFTSAQMRESTEQNAEWERRFKVDAIMLRDELLSRLEGYEQEDKMKHVYEHPTNYFGFNDVANDLERMAKLLQTHVGGKVDR